MPPPKAKHSYIAKFSSNKRKISDMEKRISEQNQTLISQQQELEILVKQTEEFKLKISYEQVIKEAELKQFKQTKVLQLVKLKHQCDIELSELAKPIDAKQHSLKRKREQLAVLDQNITV